MKFGIYTNKNIKITVYGDKNSILYLAFLVDRISQLNTHK